MNKKVLIVEDQFIEANYLRSMLEKAGYTVTGIARSVARARELIKEDKPGLALLDIMLSGKHTGIDLARELREDHIAFIYLSANSNEDVLAAAKVTQPYGFLVKPFREKDLLIALEIAAYRHEHSQESMIRKETNLQEQLSAIIAGSYSREKKLSEIGKALQPHIPFDLLIAAGFHEPDDNEWTGAALLRTGFDEYQMLGIAELLTITRLTSQEINHLSSNTAETTTTLYNDTAFEQITLQPSLHSLFADTFHVRSCLSIPLSNENNKPLSLSLYSKRPDTYNTTHLSLCSRLQKLLTTGLESILIDSEQGILKHAAKKEHNEIAHNDSNIKGFEGIIGRSHLLLTVFDHIAQVAPTDTSVLILGESGTGKEKIAACIHHISSRKTQRLVTVNCAALPATLIESELFGHEKGAFTGATDRRIGKFEQADKGTVFLDEIGELPLELQVKLLRVLQEKEIERIGSRMPNKIDVRFIAATNRNLEKEVAEGRFRLDLYYRLNVFPVMLPPLRERTEDIPALAYHFMNLYNRKAGKKISGYSDRSLKNMMAYSWPGNIRELEHIIERSVLLAKGTIIEDIHLPLNHGKEKTTDTDHDRMKTIHENERDHIISVLKKCNGRIWGAGAAAEILNIPPTTLKSKMNKLGIKRTYIN